MQTLKSSIFGGIDPWHFLGLTLWALIGAYILIQINNNSRDPSSSRTPVKFTWRVWFMDNLRRVVFNLILILVTIRFSPELTGKEVNEFWALLIGFSSDGIAILLNKFKIMNLIGTYKAPWLGKNPEDYLSNKEGGDK